MCVCVCTQVVHFYCEREILYTVHSVCVCPSHQPHVYLRIRTYTNTPTHTPTHTHTHTHTRTHIRTHAHTHTHTPHTHAHTHAHTNAHTHTHMHVHTHTHACAYTPHACAHAHARTHSHARTHAHTHTCVCVCGGRLPAALQGCWEWRDRLWLWLECQALATGSVITFLQTKPIPVRALARKQNYRQSYQHNK